MLGDVVKPGYYISVNNGTHSCIFLEWSDHFVPKRQVNNFRAIGGNQSGTVNIMDRTAYNGWGLDDKSPKHDVSWMGNQYNDDSYEIKMFDDEKVTVRIYDGFGKTGGGLDGGIRPK